jgi:fatty-acyl-CoA synthase
MALPCQYVGEICRFLLSAPATDSDREHSLRKMAEPASPEIWQQWTSRFGAVFQIYEGWGARSPTPTPSIWTIASAPAAAFPSGKTNLRLVRYDQEKAITSEMKTAFCNWPA